MHRVFVLLLWLLGNSVAKGAIVDSTVFINELHYDNVGTDKDEFVEVAAPLSWSDLSSVTLTLYNGGNGQTYAGPTPLSSFTRRGSVAGWAFYTFDISLQNGAPDGLALARGNDVLQFLSYEGTFIATEGVASGLTSTDLQVFEPADAPLGTSLQLTGHGDSYADFRWESFAMNTYGDLNQGQSFVPEPSSVATWLVSAGALALLGWRQRCRRRQTASNGPVEHLTERS
jgi:hypothetical protein